MPQLRTARSETFARADGSMRTVVYAAPVNYRAGDGSWGRIKSRFVPSAKDGVAWRNEAAGFSAEVKADSRSGLVRFGAGDALFDLSLEGVAGRAVEKLRENEVRYAEVRDQVDLEYVLLPSGLKETLVLKEPSAPSSYAFRVVPAGGSIFELVDRPDGGLDIRTEASALPVATISAPVVTDSKWVTVEDAAGTRRVLVDDLPARGMASMSAERDGSGGYLVRLRIDESWLAAKERVFPVKLDPTVTTVSDIQDGYFSMACPTCTPEMVGSSLYTGGDPSSSIYSAAMVFSLAELPAGASITSARLDAYQVGCWNQTCGWQWGAGQVGQARLYRLTSPWGSSTTTSALTWDAGVLASRGFDMWWAADQVNQWKSWEGAGLTSYVQGVVNGSLPNHGLLMDFAPPPGAVTWGPIFAGSRWSDPSLAPRMELQWVSDGVQLHPATNIHSDGAELTWSRFAPGFGPYASAVLSDNPALYWRMNDQAGSPFGVSDWSGNSQHGAPAGVAFGQAGATADGDTSLYLNGSSAVVDTPPSSLLAGITDTFTAEAWIKRGSFSGTQTIMARGGNDSQGSGGGFRIQLSGTNQLVLARGDFGNQIAASTVPIDGGGWYHVAVTKAGGDVKLYINGIDRTGTVSNQTMTAGIVNVTVGANPYHAGEWLKTDWFNGWIDEAAVYPVALSAAQISAHVAAAATAGSGFQRFDVHRSEAAGFTPSAATKIASVKDPAVQYYRDTTAKGAASFYYKVVTVGTGGSYTSNQLQVGTPAAGNATITVQPGVSLLTAETTTLASGSACANNGGAGGVTASASQRGLIRFDLRQIPTGSQITSATVSLWTFQDGGARTINLHRASADWVEGTGVGACDASGASWTDRQPNVPWSTAGADYDTSPAGTFTSGGAAPHWETTNLTSLVQEWVSAGKPNLGLLIKHATEAGAPPITWTSDEYAGSAALRPKLVVSYQDGSDPKEPSVRLGAPGDGASLAGSVTVTAAAGDDSRVTQVEFLRGNTVFATDTSAPWQATLETSGLANGALELKARATDDVGQVTTSSPIAVTVATSAPPTTAVTGASGTAVLTVNASAADDTGVAKVEFFVDGDRFATDTSSPYQASLDTLAFPVYDGPHTLTTRAHDGHGNATSSDAYAITVANTAGTSYQAEIAAGEPQNLTTEVPVGAVLPYAGSPSAVPAGWALADGATLSRTTYGGLFAAIGTAYGAGDGSTTFNLPDLRGRLPLGKATSGTWATLAATGGSLSMGGGSISLPTISSLSFPTPTVSFSAGAVSAFTPPGFSFPTGVHYTYWTGDSALASVSVGSGGGLGAGWTTFTMPSQTAASGSVAPTASLSTATAAYRVVSYIVKTTAAAASPVCAIWPSARTAVPADAQAADGSTASGALAACLAAEYGGATPDLRGRFPLGKAASGTGSSLNDAGGSRDFTHTITRSVPAASVTVPNYATSLTVPSGSYPASYTWNGFGQGNGQDVWLFRCIGGSGNGTCLPANATTPSVATPSASGGGGGPLTSQATSDQTATAAYNPAYLALDYYTGTSTPAAGSLAAYTSATAPVGWLPADGACVSQTRYSALFAAIGSTYGSCAAGEFKLPNLRGRFPLGTAASGTGSTLGQAGGSLDLTPAAALPGFTTSFSWTPSNFNFSVPARTATLNLGSNYDHQYPWASYASVLWNGTGSFTSSAFGATTFTATPSPPGARTVNSTAAGATTATFAAENPPFQVVDYLIATGPITAPESFIPTEVRYDASAGTQEQNRTTVYLTNDSTQTWAASSIFLRYRWIAPDGSISSSANVPLGADVAPAATRAVQVDFDPPTLLTGVQRSLYTLRFDLVDASTGTTYFAAAGNQPLERSVLVTRVSPLELGLERYQQYEPLDLGAGLTASANLGSGNLVVSGNLLDNPGRGLSTLLDLTYNSQETSSFAPLGAGFTLGSGLARLGQPLDIHPNASDAALGRTAKWIGFADADGSYHRFNGRTIAGSDTYYDEPAGVHLYLRATGSSDPAKYWALTRPDRISFYFDQDGWPTRTEDADGNALTYTLTSIAAGEDVYGLAKRVTKITDAGGREVTLAYYSNADMPTRALRGRLKSLTDHAGLVTKFEYYEDGRLMKVTQSGGTGDDGSFVPGRSLVFTYTNAVGSGPAISTLAGRQNPPPDTTQGALLYSVIDYRGNETAFAYTTSGQFAKRLAAWTDRAGKTTTFSFGTSPATTTVARPLSRTSTYRFDADGRVTLITNPLGLNTSILWTSGNNVERVTNDTTGRYLEYAYNANGYLTDSWDEKRNRTVLTYENLTVDADDASANWPVGRAIPHLSQLASYTQPVGVATTGSANDYRWSFGYTSSGNLASVTDPLSNVTSNTYNPDGTLQSTTLPSNGDGITRTTTFSGYDANGLPTQVTDAAGGIAKAAYGGDGRPLWIQDPIHAADSGADTRSYRDVFEYEGYGRYIRTSSPKSTALARGVLIWSETRYDPNDNAVAAVAPYYALEGGGYGSVSTSAYDAMDRPTSMIGPDSSSGGSEETQTVYDDAGRVVKLITPKGVRTAFTDDFTTVTGYDLLDRPISVSEYELDGAGAIITSKTRTSVYCYDPAGDLRSVTGPKGASGFSCPAATAWPYTPTTQSFTVTYGYDEAHRQLSETNELDHESTTAHDANGAVTSETDAAGKVRQTFYTDRGEPERVVTPFDTGRSLTEKTEYDALGNVKREISLRAWDAAGGGPTFTDYVSSHSYDALGRPVKTTLPKAASETQAYTHSAYDGNGRLTWTSLPTTAATAAAVATADKTVNEYWDSGSIYTTTVGGSPKTRFDYTAEGWQAWRLPETAEGTGVADYGRMMFWEHYPDGRLKAERDLAGQRASFGYDASGNRTSAAEAQSIAGDAYTIATTFNGFDELEKVTTPKTGTANNWVSVYGYDQHGNLTTLVENREETGGGSVVTPGRSFGYSYDAADQPLEQTDDFATTAIDTDDERFSFEFDELGRLKKRTVAKRTGASSYATEQTQESGYFFNGLPKTLVSKDGAATTIASHTLSYIQAGIYLNGNKTQDIFRVANPDTNAPCRTSDCTASWEYDGRERLTKAIDGTGTTSEFTLDPAGNVTLEKRNGSTYRTATHAGQRLATASTGGVSSRYLYDGQGNVDCVVLASWASNTCPATSSGQPVATELLSDNAYDYRDRLVAVRAYNAGAAGDKTEYRYDPLSRPVRKTATENGTTTTTELVYLGIADAVVRETETGATTKTRTYAFDVLGDRASISETVSGSTSRHSYAYDPLGSAELLLDQANAVKASYGYTAYGDANPLLTKTASGFSPNTNPYTYTGKRWDPAAKAFDMGARHYFPAAGHWFQQDQYADALANLGLSTDPLNANRYLFTGANPVNFVELDGHGFMPAFVADGGDDTGDPYRQAALLADGFTRLGCGTGKADAFICRAIVEGAQQQIDLYKDRNRLCQQTGKPQHCIDRSPDWLGLAAAGGILAAALALPVAVIAVAARTLVIRVSLGAVAATVRIVIAGARVAEKYNLDPDKLARDVQGCLDDALLNPNVFLGVIKCGKLVLDVFLSKIPLPRRGGP